MVLKRVVAGMRKLLLSSRWIVLGCLIGCWVLPVHAQTTLAGGKQPRTNAVGPQPNDAPVPDDEGQSGVKGAMVDSIRKGPNAEKHFVSPKKVGDFVRLRAQIPHDLEGQFDTLFQWVKPKDPDDPTKEVGTADGYFFDVPRDKPGKYTVQVCTRGTSTTTIDKINVWIVWCDVTATFVTDEPVNFYIPPSGNGAKIDVTAIFKYKATINPRSICNQNDDIPDLRYRRSSTPHHAYKHAFDGHELGEVPYAWDLTRQWRERDLAPTITGHDAGFPAKGALYGTLPNGDIIQTTCEDPTTGGVNSDVGYPRDEVEGNDEKPGNDISPYGGSQYGVLFDDDPPTFGVLYSAGGNLGETAEFRSQFREFVRLNIGERWYKVSDYAYARYHAKFKKISEVQEGKDVDGDGQISHVLWNLVDDPTTGGYTNNENF